MGFVLSYLNTSAPCIRYINSKNISQSVVFFFSRIFDYSQLLMKSIVLIVSLCFSYTGLTAQRSISVPSAAKTALVAATPNQVYMGFRNEGLYWYNGLSVDTVPFYLPSKQIRSLAYVQNVLWVGTANGLYKVEGNQVSHFSQAGGQLPADTVLSLCVWQNQLVVGTNGGLVFHQGSQWNSFTSTNSNLPANRVVSVRSAFNRLAIVAGSQAGFWQQQFVPIVQNAVAEVRIAIPFEGAGAILSGDQQGCWWLPGQTPKLLPEFAGVTDLQQRSNGMLVGVSMFRLAFFQYGEAWDLNLRRHAANSGFLAEDGTGMLHVLASNVLYSATDFRYVDDVHNTQNVKSLHINKVKAKTGNKGSLFHLRFETNPAFNYAFPNEQSATGNIEPTTFFALSPWIGGFYNGQLHQSAQQYGTVSDGGMPYFPGPLLTGGTLDTNLAASFDRIWKVGRYDIEHFKWAWQQGLVQSGAYLPSRDLREWPGNHPQNGSVLAPFFDRNADGQYNYLDGDYPLIKGDQALWMIWNDLNPLRNNEAPALGVEMQVMLYAYQCNQQMAADSVLNYTTFVEFKVKNRSEKNYEQAYFTLWNDVSIGRLNDDYVGTDVKNHGICFYNGDDNDDLPNGFGANPPAQGIYWLKGPIAPANDGIDNDRDGQVDEQQEQVLLSYSMYNVNDNGPTGHANSARHFELMSRGRFKDSTQMVFGGNGYPNSAGATNTPARFMFPMQTDSVGWGIGGSLQSPMVVPFAWSEANPGPGVQANTPFKRRMHMSARPFHLAAGQEQSMEFALIYSRANSGGAMASLQKLLQVDAPRIRQWYNQSQFPSCLDLSTVAVNETRQMLQLRSYPNPAKQELFVETATEEPVKLCITDIQGRIVFERVMEGQLKYHLDLPAATPGLYLLHWEQAGFMKTEKLLRH